VRERRGEGAEGEKSRVGARREERLRLAVEGFFGRAVRPIEWGRRRAGGSRPSPRRNSDETMCLASLSCSTLSTRSETIRERYGKELRLPLFTCCFFFQLVQHFFLLQIYRLLARNGSCSSNAQQLTPDEVVEPCSLARELVVRSLLSDFTVLHHHDRVGGFERREAVRKVSQHVVDRGEGGGTNR
jgi:hypothetical protein